MVIIRRKRCPCTAIPRTINDPHGWPGTGGVIDYINAGDGQDLYVSTEGDHGVVVNLVSTKSV